MTPLIVLVSIAAVLFLLSLLRFGGEVRYDEDGFAAWARVACFRFQVYPSKLTDEEKAAKEEKKRLKEEKKKAKKAKRAKKQPDTPPEEAPKKKGGSLSLILKLIPPMTRAAGKLLRKIRVNDLDLQVVWGASNPADAALGYGYASAAMGTIWGPLEESFRVKRKHLACYVDYDAQKPAVLAHLTLTITLGQALAIALPLLVQILKLRVRTKDTTGHKLTKEA